MANFFCLNSVPHETLNEVPTEILNKTGPSFQAVSSTRLSIHAEGRAQLHLQVLFKITPLKHHVVYKHERSKPCRCRSRWEQKMWLGTSK